MKKKYRIKKNQEFQEILKAKHFVASPSMVIYTKPRKEDHARFGITVSKKLGKAVVRNKMKRQLRMMIQDVFDFDEPYDAIIMTRKEFLNRTYHENLETMRSLKQKVTNNRRKHD